MTGAGDHGRDDDGGTDEPGDDLAAKLRDAGIQDTGFRETPAEHRSGFACFVGRPNAGKSTLTNALVGTKIAITSTKPQTTRHAVRGIVHRDDAQLIIVDTPGLHRPRTLLGERLNDVVRATWSEVDVVGFCVPAGEKIGPGDKYIAAELAKIARRTPVVGIVTKTDLVKPEVVAEQLLELQQLMELAELVPVSATSGYQLDTVADVLVSQLPEGPQLYPDGDLTDEPEQRLVAELIREAALEGVRDELPHSIAVTVEEMIPREGSGDMVDIYAHLFVERQSQKAIVLGHKAGRLKQVGATARTHIEALLGSKVYLDLHVKVAKEWQRDAKQLGRLGF
ncbi:GTPase Era [Prauserella halophila]|uniref:GTPase Era n=1 Tax=Prauserella halophila TaxID=185641 RepID=A0ABP4GFU0_9PSEU|nr:GTP-binding protein Era [Prauserella halophila]